MTDPIRARLDVLRQWGDAALRAVLDLFDREHPNEWPGYVSNAVYGQELDIRRVIAEHLGVTDV